MPGAQETAAAVRVARPMPQWRWRTFPVFTALALGLFIGVLFGIPAGVLSEQGNGSLIIVVWVVPAIMLGLAFSRIMTRFLLSKNWIKPRPPRRAR